MSLNTETVKLIGVLTAVFPNHLSADGVRTYATLLADVPVGVLKVAVEQCANDCKFFPSVAEIRDRVAKVTAHAPVNAAEAWEDVMIAIKRDGFYRIPTFDNPITQRTVNAMDWQALCSSENTIADRAHFMKLYDLMAERGKQDAKLIPSAKALRAELSNEPRQLPAHETVRADSAGRIGSGNG